MISSATVQSAIVLTNRRMKTERDVITFVPVCSSVTGMHLHHLEGRRAAQEWSVRFEETADPPTPQAVERVYPLHAVADVVVAASLCLPRRSQAEAGRGVWLALVLLAARRHPPSRCFGAAGSAVSTTRASTTGPMLSRNRNGKGVHRGERLFNARWRFWKNVDLADTLPYACGLAEHDTPGHRSILTRRVISPSDLLRRGRWTWRSSLHVRSRCRGRHCIFVCLCRSCGIHCIFFCRIRSHFF